MLAIAIAAFCFPVVQPVEHGFDIYFNGAPTTGIVEEAIFRRSVTYTYSVAGHTYRGSSYGRDFPEAREGGPIKVRYSVAHPERSTAHAWETFFGQLGVGALFASGGLLVAYRAYRASKARAAY